MEKNKVSNFFIINFKIIPKFVGVWKGEWICLDKKANFKKIFKATLEQKIVNNCWIQSNHNIYEDGSRETWNYFGKATGTNKLLLESTDQPYDGFKMIMHEMDNNVIILKVFDKKSLKILAIETFFLENNFHRIRTIQQFCSKGLIRGFMIINENKIY